MLLIINTNKYNNQNINKIKLKYSLLIISKINLIKIRLKYNSLIFYAVVPKTHVFERYNLILKYNFEIRINYNIIL